MVYFDKPNSKKNNDRPPLNKVVFCIFRDMKNTKSFLLYGITLVAIVAVILWDNYMQAWLALQPDGGEDVLRTDLFVIYPVITTLVVLSLYRLFKKRSS
jgi:hypothetical protein